VIRSYCDFMAHGKGMRAQWEARRFRHYGSGGAAALSSLRLKSARKFACHFSNMPGK